MYYIDRLPSDVYLGISGTDNQLSISFDVSTWAKKWPDAYFAIAVGRPSETPDQKYFADISYEDGVITWPVVLSDVVNAGFGWMEIHAVSTSNNRFYAKTRRVTTRIAQSETDVDTDVPEAAEPWTQRVIQKSAVASAAADTATAAAETAVSAKEDAVAAKEDAEAAAEAAHVEVEVETERAISAETGLADAIALEASTARQNEMALGRAIQAEAERAAATEEALDDKIDSLPPPPVDSVNGMTGEVNLDGDNINIGATFHENMTVTEAVQSVKDHTDDVAEELGEDIHDEKTRAMEVEAEINDSLIGKSPVHINKYGTLADDDLIDLDSGLYYLDNDIDIQVSASDTYTIPAKTVLIIINVPAQNFHIVFDGMSYFSYVQTYDRFRRYELVSNVELPNMAVTSVNGLRGNITLTPEVIGAAVKLINTDGSVTGYTLKTLAPGTYCTANRIQIGVRQSTTVTNYFIEPGTVFRKESLGVNRATISTMEGQTFRYDSASTEFYSYYRSVPADTSTNTYDILGVNADLQNEIQRATNTEINKLDKYQGTEHAGKILTVNASGYIVPIDVATLLNSTAN